MNIDETLAYIHTTDWRGTKPGLTRIRALLDRLGNPERQLKFVHVTGTNGKGSTCAMLASILHEAGLRTGLYTSPYIVRFNERIQVDGEQIPDDALCALTEEVRAQADAMPDHPSEFELVTAIAMLWFLRSRCDIVVCEVGMGGEFDATNVIPAPEAAVFTNIGLDHMQYLGGTVEEISVTKAGILKPGLRRSALPLRRGRGGCHRRALPRAGRAAASGGLLLPAPDRRVAPAADFQLRRTVDAAPAAARRLPAAKRRRRADGGGRAAWTRLEHSGARRARGACARVLAGEARGCAARAALSHGRRPQSAVRAGAGGEPAHLSPKPPAHGADGVLADKDWQHMFAPLAPLAEGFVTVTPDNPRALDAQTLAEGLRAFGKPVTACFSIAEGVRLAKARAGAHGAVLCCGSLYLLGDVLTALET